LYTGVVAPKDTVMKEQFYSFLKLHCAYILFCSEKQRQRNVFISQEMLNVFVEIFSSVFGKNSVFYNVHGLLDVCETFTVDGDPISGSSYAFEIYLQTLK